MDAPVPNCVPQQLGPQLKVLPDLGLKLATKSIVFGLLRSVLDVVVGPNLAALLVNILAVELLVPGARVVEDLDLPYFRGVGREVLADVALVGRCVGDFWAEPSGGEAQEVSGVDFSVLDGHLGGGDVVDAIVFPGSAFLHQLAADPRELPQEGDLDGVDSLDDMHEAEPVLVQLLSGEEGPVRAPHHLEDVDPADVGSVEILVLHCYDVIYRRLSPQGLLLAVPHQPGRPTQLRLRCVLQHQRRHLAVYDMVLERRDLAEEIVVFELAHRLHDVLLGGLDEVPVLHVLPPALPPLLLLEQIVGRRRHVLREGERVPVVLREIIIVLQPIAELAPHLLVQLQLLLDDHLLLRRQDRVVDAAVPLQGLDVVHVHLRASRGPARNRHNVVGRIWGEVVGDRPV